VKFFTISRIRQAIGHLNSFKSGWVIGPLVYIANQIDSDEYRAMREGVGSDKFLDKFFHPRLIGLPSKQDEESLRPIFKEMGQIDLGNPAKDVVEHQGTKIWGKIYTQTWADALKKTNVIEQDTTRKGFIRLRSGAAGAGAPLPFTAALEAALPADFCFEELLVWLNAFSGFSDHVGSWQGLWEDFATRHLDGRTAIPAAYASRFRIRQGEEEIPWPATDITNDRPSDQDFIKGLIPSAFSDAITSEQWATIVAVIEESLLAGYEGMDDEQARQIAEGIVTSLASSKRVFILGDPGTGKTKLANSVVQAFEAAVEKRRVHRLEVTVTGRTTETSLMGFGGLDGTWIDGELTAEVGGKRLLYPVRDANGQAGDLERRNQVNVVVLNEANRTDVEALLARIQHSLDSSSRAPGDPDHRVVLGGAGAHTLSPWTFVIMTGNSPRDDMGRLGQSRPLQRRVGMVWMRNALAPILRPTQPIERFQETVARIWEKHRQRSILSAEQAEGFAALLRHADALPAVAALRTVLHVLDAHQGGASFALLEKVIVAAANHLHVRPGAGEPAPADLAPALDKAVFNGLSAVLGGTVGMVEGRALKQSLAEAAPPIADLFPVFSAWASDTLSDVSAIGSVEPLF
jgi:energy-coupling factor transporter ATP-binding protein EcfA2